MTGSETNVEAVSKLDEISMETSIDVVPQIPTESDSQNIKYKPKYDRAFKVNLTKLVIMMILALIVSSAEISVGVIAGSLALISDAFHMFSDFFGLIIGAVALGVCVL